MLAVRANPAVRLNQAVAIGERDGPAAVLASLDAIDGLDRAHLWHAARADALARLGRPGDAATALRRAIDLAGSTPGRATPRSALARPTGYAQGLPQLAWHVRVTGGASLLTQVP